MVLHKGFGDDRKWTRRRLDSALSASGFGLNERVPGTVPFPQGTSVEVNGSPYLLACCVVGVIPSFRLGGLGPELGGFPPENLLGSSVLPNIVGASD